MKTLHRALAVLTLLSVGLFVCSACGGGGSNSSGSTGTGNPTSPTGGGTPAGVVDFAPYTFSVSAATTTDQSLIHDSVQFATTFFLTTFGRTVTQSTSISASTTASGCAQGGSAAFTGAGQIIFCVGNPGWLQNGTLNRQKIVMHELFHVWQFEEHWLGNAATAGPTWIIEGSAELVGFRAAVAEGLFPSNSVVQGCMAKQVSDFAQQQPPGLNTNLQVYEPASVFQNTVGPLYALSWLAMDELVNTSGITALKTYGDGIGGGTPASGSFQTAFGMTLSPAFYNQFPAYKNGLTVPASYVCGG